MSTVDGRHHVKVAGHSWKSFALVLSVNERTRKQVPMASSHGHGHWHWPLSIGHGHDDDDVVLCAMATDIKCCAAERERHLWEDFSRKIRNCTGALQKKQSWRLFSPHQYYGFYRHNGSSDWPSPIISSFSSESQDYFCVSNWYTFVSWKSPREHHTERNRFWHRSLLPFGNTKFRLSELSCVFACKIAPYSASCIFVQKQRKRQKQEKEKCAKCE